MYATGVYKVYATSVYEVYATGVYKVYATGVYKVYATGVYKVYATRVYEVYARVYKVYEIILNNNLALFEENYLSHKIMCTEKQKGGCTQNLKQIHSVLTVEEGGWVSRRLCKTVSKHRVFAFIDDPPPWCHGGSTPSPPLHGVMMEVVVPPPPHTHTVG